MKSLIVESQILELHLFLFLIFGVVHAIIKLK